jgi:hypothetical protein
MISIGLCLAAVRPAVAQEPASPSGSVERVARFFGGAATAFVAHESGHVFFDLVFSADPGIKRVEFHDIPFFAISHDPVSPRQEFVISSAGFWVQEGIDEWLLTTRPALRRSRAPFAKGLLAFNIGASVAYAGAAFARTGPPERDTLGMARSARIDERWVGALILAPAVLDGWRYLDPDARWPVWLSRANKAGGVLLVFR